MASKARIAVVGAGWWSTYAHIPALQANPDAELVALCDTDPEKLRAAAAAYGIEHTYADHRAMIAAEQPDGIVIATPHATHYGIARDCLEQHVHVLIEKPMTLHAAEARELVDLASSHNRELIVGYTYNFQAQTIRARETMRSGLLGPIQYVNCVMVSRVLEFLRGDSAPDFAASVFPVHGPGAVYSQPHLSGGGQGHLQITHMAGLLFFVTNLRAQRVIGLMQNHGLALDLVDAMVVEFEDGALGTVGGSGNAYEGRLDLQLHCERGSLVLDLIAGTTTIRSADGKNEKLERERSGRGEDERFRTSNNLVDVVLSRAPNGAPGEVGWRAVELLDAAYRSAGQGGIPISVASLYT